MLLLNDVQEDDAGSYNCTGFINGQLQSAHVVVKTKSNYFNHVVSMYMYMYCKYFWINDSQICILEPINDTL